MTTPQEITKRLCCPECGKTGGLRLRTIRRSDTDLEFFNVRCGRCGYKCGLTETSAEQALSEFLTYCQYAEHVTP